MNKKLIVGLIIFLVVVLVSIIGVFAFTKIINSPKKVFAKNLKAALEEVSGFEPKPLKDIYDATQNEIVETSLETKIEYSDELSSAGSSNLFNSSSSLDFEDERYEGENRDSEDRGEDEDNSENSQEYGDNDEDNRDNENDRDDEVRLEEQENDQQDTNNENENDTDAFLDSYTWDENGYVSSNNDSEKYNIDLKFNSTIDLKNKNENISLNAKINDKTFVIGNLNYKKNIIGLFIEGLNEKYIALENKNLRNVAKNYGVEDDVLEYFPDSIEIMNSNYDEYKNFADKTVQYVNSVLNEFDEKQYSTNTFSDSLGVNFSDNYEGTVSTLRVPVKTLKKKIYEYGMEVLKDNNSLSSVKESLSKETLEYAMKEIEYRIKEIESIDESEVGDISIYITNNGIVKLSFTTESDNMDNAYFIVDKVNNKFELDIDSKTSSNSSTKELLMPAHNSNVYFEVNESNIIVKTSDSYSENDLKAMMEEYNSKIEDSEERTEIVEDDEENEDSGFVNFYNSKKELNDYKKMYPNSENTVTISYKPNESGLYSGDIKLSSKENGKKTNTFDSIKSLKYDVKKSDGKSIVDVNSDNSIVINDFKEEDFQSLIVESLANMDKYAQENEMSWASIVRRFMSLFSENMDSYDAPTVEVDDEDDLVVNGDGEENGSNENEEAYGNEEENEEENRDEE